MKTEAQRVAKDNVTLRRYRAFKTNGGELSFTRSKHTINIIYVLQKKRNKYVNLIYVETGE